MRVIIQRVSKASVEVENKIVGEIQKGLLVLVGFQAEDNEEDFLWMIKKIKNLRIFNDPYGIMNLSVDDVLGTLLVVSQFTLLADTKKGNRPSYTKASIPSLAIHQYNRFLESLKENYKHKIEIGIFGADMKVNLVNDGPVTFYLDSKNK